MVAPTNFNLQALHGRTFQGFVQFQIPDGSVWYRMKERQQMTFNIRFDRAPHYNDAGLKANDPAGFSHSFTMDLKVTSDLFDDIFSASSDKQTLSYWIFQNTINEPITVIFVTSMEMLLGPSGSTDEDTVNIKFVLDPTTFSPSMGASGGAPSITVSGDVLSITSAVRDSTSEQA